MESLAIIAIIVLCMAWHRQRCKGCREQMERDAIWAKNQMIEQLRQIQKRMNRRFR